MLMFVVVQECLVESGLCIVVFGNILEYYRLVRKTLYALILIISHRTFIVYKQVNYTNHYICND